MCSIVSGSSGASPSGRAAGQRPAARVLDAEQRRATAAAPARGRRTLRLRHQQRAQARKTVAVHAAARDEFGQRVLEFGAQQVRAADEFVEERCAVFAQVIRDFLRARGQRRILVAALRGRRRPRASWRRGSSTIGVARTGAARPPCPSAGALRRRAQVVRPGGAQIVEPRDRIIARRARAAVPLPRRRPAPRSLRVAPARPRALPARSPRVAATTRCQSNRKRMKSRGSTGSISRRRRPIV